MKSSEKISLSLRTRHIKYGGYAAIITIAVIAVLIGVNLIAQVLAPQFDMTQNKLFSISEQSEQVVDNLKNPVTIYCLWEPGKETVQVKQIVDLYAGRSKNIVCAVLMSILNISVVGRRTATCRILASAV